MKLIKSLLAIFFVVSLATSQEKEIKITSKKIADNIFMLKGKGGNIGLFVGDDGVFMIDDQFAPLTPKILQTIKSITNKPVTYLINTHLHGDHTGGNLNMQKEGAIIVSHKNVRKRMSIAQVIRGKKRAASPKEALPIITFSDDMVFYLNGEEILITHIHNAHTDGDAIIYFTKSNVLHVGDAFFQGKFPYIDLNSGGSIDGYVSGIEKMILISDNTTKIIPGHGSVSSKKELETYLAMLVDLKKKITTEIKAGKSLDEVKRNKSITKNYKNYNGWIDEEKIKEVIYKSLKK